MSEINESLIEVPLKALLEDVIKSLIIKGIILFGRLFGRLK